MQSITPLNFGYLQKGQANICLLCHAIDHLREYHLQVPRNAIIDPQFRAKQFKKNTSIEDWGRILTQQSGENRGTAMPPLIRRNFTSHILNPR